MNIENVIESGKEAMKNSLKPCPFCGCNVINLHQETYADGYFWAWFECRLCGARGQTRRYMGVTFDPTLRDTWNNRKESGGGRMNEKHIEILESLKAEAEKYSTQPQEVKDALGAAIKALKSGGKI